MRKALITAACLLVLPVSVLAQGAQVIKTVFDGDVPAGDNPASIN